MITKINKKICKCEKRYKRNVAEFLKKYPNYCKICNASGEIWYEDHEGILTDTSCSNCIDKDLCPRCMTATMIRKERIIKEAGSSAWKDFWVTCSVCKWLGNDDYGEKYCYPFPFVCICSYD